MSNSFSDPWTVAHQTPLSIKFPGKKTGVGCHFLLQGIFLTLGLKPCLLYYRLILYHWTSWEALNRYSLLLFFFFFLLFTMLSQGLARDLLLLTLNLIKERLESLQGKDFDKRKLGTWSSIPTTKSENWISWWSPRRRSEVIITDQFSNSHCSQIFPCYRTIMVLEIKCV